MQKREFCTSWISWSVSIRDPIDELISFIFTTPLINAGNFTVEEEVEETPDEQESEPESEPEPVLTPEPDPEPDQDLKSEASEMTNPTPETPEDNWEQEDGCADVRKVAVCEKNSLSTSQVYIHLLVCPSGHRDFAKSDVFLDQRILIPIPLPITFP